MEKSSLCLLCDESYNPEDSAAVLTHENPEPQSGAFRDYWLWSKLSYQDWIIDTEKGKEWLRLKEHQEAA